MYGIEGVELADLMHPQVAGIRPKCSRLLRLMRCIAKANARRDLAVFILATFPRFCRDREDKLDRIAYGSIQED